MRTDDLLWADSERRRAHALLSRLGIPVHNGSHKYSLYGRIQLLAKGAPQRPDQGGRQKPL